MSESDTRTVKRIGSFTILGGLGATLVAGLIGWIASTTVENKITFAPIVAAIDTLNTNLEKQDSRSVAQEFRNTTEHELIIDKLQKINTRININETKLFRVMDDCDENNIDIKHCQQFHRGSI